MQAASGTDHEFAASCKVFELNVGCPLVSVGAVQVPHEVSIVIGGEYGWHQVQFVGGVADSCVCDAQHARLQVLRRMRPGFGGGVEDFIFVGDWPRCELYGVREAIHMCSYNGLFIGVVIGVMP